MKTKHLFLLLLFLWPLILLAQQEGAGSRSGVWIDIDGAIGPATTDYVERAIDLAAEEQAQLIILRIDTPGGLESSMRDINKVILASPVPVVGYVFPNGARAASAGTFLLYASHVAAMAPATNLGAATPVSIAPTVSPPATPGSKEPVEEARPDAEKSQEQPVSLDAKSQKAINDAVAYIRSLASLRGRNADWAEKAVREAASLDARSALELGVIDIVASDMSKLLVLLDGRRINILGQEVTLATEGLLLNHIEPDTGRYYQPQRRLYPDADRHLRADSRILQPGKHSAGSDRCHLPAACAICVSAAAYQLCRPVPDSARCGVNGWRGL
ncbi:hypothetical protein [Solemya velum gill symbiont]|uniref:NfeD1b N-terminal domain-containing protein n=1 Tax=Solemya velum gill symbiont TaxID=2340 RepID=A0A0B0HBF8_SOVGS|nr:hypothetical protein [Solemya velum gill symbiont]KHF24781.1 hypothetical protein JV46_03110 [Solemya velum gill symbiont]